MRIGVLVSSYEGSSSALQEHDPYLDPSPHHPTHVFERCLIHKATAASQIQALSQRGFDAFINLCDGSSDEDLAGVEVVWALERLGLPFTGAGSAFYEPTRAAMKASCAGAGISTPAFVFAASRSDVERAAETLRFPLLVKHPNSYCSIGMTRASRVESRAELHVQAEQMIGAFTAALIEEFIEGREFTVLVVESAEGAGEALALAPLEVRFTPGESFKHFDLKWIDHAQLTLEPVLDAALSERLKDASRRFFTAMKGTGYARCDLRMSHEGELFMLEINPNCGVFYSLDDVGSADAILLHDPLGHRGFLDHLLRCAIRRAPTAKTALPGSATSVALPG